MREKLRTRRGTVALVAIATAAAFAMLTAASSSHATIGSHSVSPAILGGGGKPAVSGPQHLKPGAATFSCQGRPIDGSQGIVCYSPGQIQQAYGYSGLLGSGVDGTGKTIVIVDAFSNPFVAGDLAIQNSTFDLPTSSFTTLQQPNAVPPFDPNNGNMDGWAEEITLDVLWAHAMAPGANIVLAEAASNNDSDILATTKYVVDHHIGDVISQSFGEAEQCMDPTLLAEQHAVFAKAVSEGYTVFASSGDSGASQGDCSTGATPLLAASTPASDPNVTGVGGTTLAADINGNYIGETAWTEQFFGCNPPDTDDINCSGGGFSTVYGRPSWQASQNKNTARGVPDVSYNAGVNGGVLTHCQICNILAGVPPSQQATTFFIFGGTSAGSPQWAALTADADQMAGGDLGSINKTLYQIGQSSHGGTALHDVTTGNNTVADLGGAGFDAGPGWDPVTGLGTPNAANLLPDLAKKG
jgi:subtilase family serine protease